jgi:hypothetical protein
MVFVPKFIPSFKTEPSAITFDVEEATKEGKAENATLPLPAFEEVPG